eukprot:TRINITY_DN9558_c0_g1_i1.p1 TRINITY_DN9558_c0_g1~~TRINITY_DN9558_c0_g1_i1.p1  ORF type:complete len:205 (+),score=18.35 TRINITY_DN9558_c0_g1_i1:92-706(+)
MSRKRIDRVDARWRQLARVLGTVVESVDSELYFATVLPLFDRIGSVHISKNEMEKVSSLSPKNFKAIQATIDRREWCNGLELLKDQIIADMQQRVGEMKNIPAQSRKAMLNTCIEFRSLHQFLHVVHSKWDLLRFCKQPALRQAGYLQSEHFTSAVEHEIQLTGTALTGANGGGCPDITRDKWLENRKFWFPRVMMMIIYILYE